MDDDAAPQDQPERPSDGPRRHDPSTGRPHASPGGARRGPGAQRDDSEPEHDPDDLGPTWGEVPVDEPAHDDGPRFGSVDSAAFAPAGRRPPTTVLLTAGLLALHGGILVISAVGIDEGFDVPLDWVLGLLICTLSAGTLQGRRWARLTTYLIEAVTFIEGLRKISSGALVFAAILLSGAILVLISLPESSAFFRARARR